MGRRARGDQPLNVDQKVAGVLSVASPETELLQARLLLAEHSLDNAIAEIKRLKGEKK